jgi:hypothetical protein
LVTFCSEVVWGPKNFPLGSQIQRHVWGLRHVPIERKHHNAANEHLDLIALIERAENGAPRACVKWTAPSSGQLVGPPEAGGGGHFPCVDRQTASFDTHRSPWPVMALACGSLHTAVTFVPNG